jgi:oligopeptide/dipeptide ABC transporter ATP-binding protein
MSAAPVLAVDGLSVEYRTEAGPAPALSDVSFALDAGQSLGLVGESGSGKTTIGLAILRHLAENGRITAGAVRFEGIDLLRLGPAELRRRRGQRIAMVYQDPANALNPSIRIGEQLAQVLRRQGTTARGELQRRTIAALERVHLPDPAHARHRYPHEFSGGQLQRIVIAMALAMNPSLLILDEPTTGLDVTVEAEILDLFEELRRSLQAAILFISHNIAVIARMCDRIAILHDGRVVETGPTDRILAAPAHPYTQRLLAARIPFGATKGPGGTPPSPRSELLTAAGVSKRYHSGRRSFLALAEAGLTLGKGEILGVVGESGSGKTTMARILAGLLLPDRGAVALEGRDITRSVERRDPQSRRAMQMVFQNPDSTLNPKQEIGAMLMRTARKLTGLRGTAAAALVERMMQAVRVDGRYLAALPGELSGGQRQRMAIARAFLANPKVVLCDEPTSALDVSVQAAILDLLVELQRRDGNSYLFISHDLAVVRYLADRVMVMYLGEVVEAGPAEEVFAEPRHPYTRTLLAAARSLHEGRSTPRLRPRAGAPSLLERPTGCCFHPRCPVKVGPDCESAPPWHETAGGRRYRCVIPPDDDASRHAAAPAINPDLESTSEGA